MVLVIPSLVNRYDILDLAEDHSLLRFMAMNGLRPLLVDWDAPAEDERDFAVADYVTRRLVPILDFIGGNVHILGYCMGGLLATALATLRRELVGSLALLATPWDFSETENGFLRLADRLEPFIAAAGLLNVDILQSLFASFQWQKTADKFTKFAAMDQAGFAARKFVLTEDWLGDGVPMTAGVARECFRNWYGLNEPGRLQWRVSGTLVDPRALTMPAYVVVPDHDRIVTPESALPLADLLPNSTLRTPALGHIGLLASRSAPDIVWKPLVEWLAATSRRAASSPTPA